MKEMYLDYRKDEITKKSRENLITTVSNKYKIDKEILIKYSQIYNDLPYINLSDTERQDTKLVKRRLTSISRSFKIKKIKNKIL